MSAQEPLSQPGLIETLLWTREQGYYLLERHLARLARSAQVLGHRHDAARIAAALRALPASSNRLRVRLVLQHDGQVDVTVQPLATLAPGTVWRAAIANIRLNS